MILSNYFYFFKKAVPDRICEDIKKYGLAQQPQIALTGNEKGKVPKTKEGFKQLHKQRNSDIVWLDETWIYREIQPYVHIANKDAGWNFQWDFSEPAQFTIYKKGQHYSWHPDSSDIPYDYPNNPNTHGKIRKITTVLILSDPEDYEGGALEFNFGNPDPAKKPNTLIPKEVGAKGSIVVFPSHVAHRVQPVTKGVRYSMPTWHLGYPFR
jgi:PKHD-type hydroxylase